MKTSSVLEPKKNAGHAARLGLLAALLIAAGVLFWQKCSFLFLRSRLKK